MKQMRPGKGWKRVGGAVYFHTSGLKVHVHGLVVLPDGRIIDGGLWPESREFLDCVRVCGGTRRGAMVWALRKLAETLAEKLE